LNPESLSRLDHAAARVASSAQTVGAMCAALSVAARVRPGAPSELLGPLETVRDDLRAAAGDLVAVGATLPRRASAPESDALTELVKAEATRSEALALADAIRRALPYAEALDTAHGRSCWADDLGDVLGKLELQVHGPQTATGARE
jgi:hypothetical protein